MSTTPPTPPTPPVPPPAPTPPPVPPSAPSSAPAAAAAPAPAPASSRLPAFAKAIVAGVLGAVAPLITVGVSQAWNWKAILAAAVTGAVSATGVYLTPNRSG